MAMGTQEMKWVRRSDTRTTHMCHNMKDKTTETRLSSVRWLVSCHVSPWPHRSVTASRQSSCSCVMARVQLPHLTIVAH